MKSRFLEGKMMGEGKERVSEHQQPLNDYQLSSFDDILQFQEPQNENYQTQTQSIQHSFKQMSQKQQSQKQQIGSVLPKSEQFFPTLGQIQRCMTLISSLMPEMFPPNVVQLFYNKLMSKFSTSPLLIPKTHLTTETQVAVKIENGTEYFQENHCQLRSMGYQGPKETNFMSEVKQKSQGFSQTQSEERKTFRKVIAQAFCKGRGYQGAKSEIAKRLPNSQFNSTIHDQMLEQLMLATEQQVQNIALEGQIVKGGKVVQAQAKSIQRVMASCRYLLSPQLCQIIFKAVEQYCSQGVILMSKEEAMRMLKGINEGITKNSRSLQKQTKSQINKEFQRIKKQRLGRVEDSQQLGPKKFKFELNKMWNTEFQRTLLDMYRAGARFAQIRERFMQHYPREKGLFTLKALRSMFFKIIRMSIRRLLSEYEERRDILPTLTKLEDQLVKNIINCAECGAIRRILVEIYMSEVCAKAKLIQAILMINCYAKAGGGIKKSAALSESEDQD